MEVVRRGSPRRPTEVKNPENVCLGCVANTLWILRSPLRGGQERRPQNDTPYFQLQYP